MRDHFVLVGISRVGSCVGGKPLSVASAREDVLSSQASRAYRERVNRSYRSGKSGFDRYSLYANIDL
jgi:hypothetical protein